MTCLNIVSVKKSPVPMAPPIPPLSQALSYENQGGRNRAPLRGGSKREGGAFREAHRAERFDRFGPARSIRPPQRT